MLVGMTDAERVQPQRAPQTSALAGVLIAVVLLVMLGGMTLGISLMISGRHVRSDERPVAGWITTTGSVVGVHRVSGKDGDTYGPVVSFTDMTGVRHTFTAPLSSTAPAMGDSAKVSYNPADPSKAHDLSDNGSSWLAQFAVGVVILSVAGLLLLLVLTILIRAWRRRRNYSAETATADE